MTEFIHGVYYTGGVNLFRSKFNTGGIYILKSIGTIAALARHYQYFKNEFKYVI